MYHNICKLSHALLGTMCWCLGDLLKIHISVARYSYIKLR